MSAQYTPEPFGYFKPEPFGWTDCAESDDDAIPLYDKVAIKLIEKQRDKLSAEVEELKLIIATDTGTESAVAAMQKQRDELLAALEGARESLDAIRLAVEPYDDIKPRDWKSDRANLRDAHTSAKETIESVDTAIASVKANT